MEVAAAAAVQEAQEAQEVPEVVVPVPDQVIHHLWEVIIVPIMTAMEGIIPTIQMIIALEPKVVGIRVLYWHWFLSRDICCS